MASPDPYATLGVSRNASDAEIKRAFRKLARKHHPDRNPNDAAAEAKFKEVQAAYEMIGDASKRQEYEQKSAWKTCLVEAVDALLSVEAWAAGSKI